MFLLQRTTDAFSLKPRPESLPSLSQNTSRPCLVWYMPDPLCLGRSFLDLMHWSSLPLKPIQLGRSFLRSLHRLLLPLRSKVLIGPSSAYFLDRSFLGVLPWFSFPGCNEVSAVPSQTQLCVHRAFPGILRRSYLPRSASLVAPTSVSQLDRNFPM